MADHPVLQEMQRMFPSLPAELVKSYVLKFSFDRDKCIHHLSYLQMTFKTGLHTYVQDVNKNNPVGSSSPSTGRRTSFPVYHNGNHEVVRNDPVWSAPVSESPFHFGKQSYAIPYRNIDPRNISPRIPSQTFQGVTQVGHNFLQGSYAEVGPHTGPRHPSPMRSPVRSPHHENLVTYNPLQLNLPENDYQFEKRISHQQQQQEHHVSILEISPGTTPFESSQFQYYTGPGPSSNQKTVGSHTTSFNVQVPSTPKPSLTTQIFVQTTLAPSPHHYSQVSSSPRYHEPVLMVPPATPTIGEKGIATQHMEVGNQLGHDEQAYSEALLVHQQAGLDLLSRELARKKIDLQRMKLDLLTEEQELFQRRSSSSNPVATVDQTGKLCDEIRKLRVDCQCMSMEVDLLNSNQVPLGVTDENFYRHIFPGQQGQIGPEKALAAVLTPVMAVAAPNQSESQNQDLPNGSSENQPLEEIEGVLWKCPQCTFKNHPYLSVCEICEIPRAPLPTACGNGPARL